jgi:YgiT-type zinc finger domain-containing protein
MGRRLFKEKKFMKCPLCKAGMTKSKTSLPYEIGEDSLIVIKDVPAIVCGQCGEFFIEIHTVRIVEQMITTAKENGFRLGFVQYRKAA